MKTINSVRLHRSLAQYVLAENTALYQDVHNDPVSGATRV